MSAPSGPIQGLLPGFLSLLQLKNKGLLPDVLQGFVQPVMDVEDYFLRGQLVNLSQGATIPAGASPGGFNMLTGGGGLAGTVDWTQPSNVWRYVENMTCYTSQLSAGDAAFFRLGYSVPGVGFFAVSPEQGGAGVGAQAVIQVYATDFWVPPGSVLGYWYFGTLGAIETLAIRVRCLDVLA